MRLRRTYVQTCLFSCNCFGFSRFVSLNPLWQKPKVLHTAVKMDNVKNLSGGTLGLENVFTKMCGSTQAADSSRLAISSYLDTFFNQNCISLRKKKTMSLSFRTLLETFSSLFFNKCVFLRVRGGYMLIYFSFNSVFTLRKVKKKDAAK